MSTQGLSVELGEAKRKAWDLVLLVEDFIAKKDPETFALMPIPKFIISKHGVEECRGLADQVGANGIFGEYGRVYELWADSGIKQGRCTGNLKDFDIMIAIPDIALQYTPAKDMYAFVHTESTKALGYHLNVRLVTFRGGHSTLRRITDQSSGLSMSCSAERDVMAALQIITRSYSWNPWKRSWAA